MLLNGKCLAACAKRNARMSPPGTGSRRRWSRIEDGPVFNEIEA